MIDDECDTNAYYCRYRCPNQSGASISCKVCPVEDNLSPDIIFIKGEKYYDSFIFRRTASSN